MKLKTKEQIARAEILLQAAYDILQKCDEGPYVKNVMDETAIWDGVECDGLCLMEDIGELLNQHTT